MEHHVGLSVLAKFFVLAALRYA